MAIYTGSGLNDSLTGSAGNDSISGLAGNDRLRTGDGQDTVDAGAGDDEVNGYPGTSTGSGYTYWDYSGIKSISGGLGNDFLVGGSGADYISGDDGNDTVYGRLGSDTLLGVTGNDYLSGSDGDDSILGGADNDTLFGGAGNDILSGDQGSDTIYGDDGSDSLSGGDGDDKLYDQDSGMDTLFGGAGNDLLNVYTSLDNKVLYGGVGSDTLYGGAGVDSLFGDDGNDYIDGDVGNDVLFGGAGSDRLYGDDGSDTLNGGDGDDYISGQDGNDSLIAGAGGDTLYGGSGSDTLVGGDGVQNLSGGDGNDTYYITSQTHYISDISGVDTAIVTASFVKIPSSIESRTYANGAVPLPYWIDALLSDSSNGLAPLSLLGSQKVIYYAFPSAIPAHQISDPEDSKGWTAFSITQQSRARDALDYLSSVLDLTFTRTNDAAAANTIVFSNNDQTGSAGSAYYPSTEPWGNDLFLDNTGNSGNTTLSDGTYAALTLIHELGHSLGLKHPFSSLDASDEVPDPPYLTGPEESTRWTVMSYNESSSQYYLRLSELDIAALQYLYGPSKTVRTGNDTYTISQSTPNFIWDGAGYDTVSAASSTLGATIHLTPGYWGYIGSSRASQITGSGQITVNFGTDIEAAVGTSYDDQIFGNGLDNALEGGGGADTLIGGGGTDSARYVGSSSQFSWVRDSVSGNISVTQLSTNMKDLLIGIERLEFSDITTNLAAFQGTEANDIFRSSAANESFSGGKGIDRVVFSASRDSFSISKVSTDSWAISYTKGFAADDISAQGFGSDQLLQIERLSFSDKSLALDISGAGGQSYRIYKAAFNRTPDSGGLGYWIAQMDGGMSLVEVASRFIDSAEFKSLYGSAPSNAEFLTKVYSNVLGRLPDPVGYAWWLNAMNTDSSKTKSKVLADFSESSENLTGTTELVIMGIEYVPWVG